MPKVSVVVPVYNVQDYVTKCLISLGEQTIDDLEVIIVNDGSTDDSKERIMNFLEDRAPKYKGKKFKYLEKPNGGLSDARNFGMKEATGDYIAFLDSDDYVDVTLYEKMYNKAIKTNADYVECDFYWTYPKKNGKLKLKKDTGVRVNTRKDMFVYARVVAWNKLIRRSLVNIIFPVGLHYEDVEFFYKLLPDIGNFAVVEEPLIYYVQREGSIANKQDYKTAQIFTILNNVIEWYKKHNLYDDYFAEIEYTYTRLVLCSSLKRISKIKDDVAREKLFYETWSNLNTKFPNWKKNKYLKKLSRKNIYLRSINKVTYKIYCGMMKRK